MSQENIEIMRAAFEAWNGDMDALREMLAPDMIARTPEGWPEPGPYVGREAWMHQLGQMRETWDADALQPISGFLDVGDRVVVRFIWRGAGHGLELNMELTGVYTVRERKITVFEFFWENLDLVRSIYADLERGDFSRTDWADPEIEVVVADGPEPGSGTGLGGMATGWREALSAWEDFRVEVDDYHEVDHERVLALIHFSGRGKTSGIEAGQMGGKGAALFHVREGNVTKMVHSWDRERAFADLGLKE